MGPILQVYNDYLREGRSIVEAQQLCEIDKYCCQNFVSTITDVSITRIVDYNLIKNDVMNVKAYAENDYRKGKDWSWISKIPITWKDMVTLQTTGHVGDMKETSRQRCLGCGINLLEEMKLDVIYEDDPILKLHGKTTGKDWYREFLNFDPHANPIFELNPNNAFCHPGCGRNYTINFPGTKTNRTDFYFTRGMFYRHGIFQPINKFAQPEVLEYMNEWSDGSFEEYRTFFQKHPGYCSQHFSETKRDSSSRMEMDSKMPTTTTTTTTNTNSSTAMTTVPNTLTQGTLGGSGGVSNPKRVQKLISACLSEWKSLERCFPRKMKLELKNPFENTTNRKDVHGITTRQFYRIGIRDDIYIEVVPAGMLIPETYKERMCVERNDPRVTRYFSRFKLPPTILKTMSSYRESHYNHPDNDTEVDVSTGTLHQEVPLTKKFAKEIAHDMKESNNLMIQNNKSLNKWIQYTGYQVLLEDLHIHPKLVTPMTDAKMKEWAEQVPEIPNLAHYYPVKIHKTTHKKTVKSCTFVFMHFPDLINTTRDYSTTTHTFHRLTKTTPLHSKETKYVFERESDPTILLELTVIAQSMVY